MKEFLRLPDDQGGYGDFCIFYIDANASVHFEYYCDGENKIGELYFEYCVNFITNGILNRQDALPYNTILSESYNNPDYERLHRYRFMLSGSDFQF